MILDDEFQGILVVCFFPVRGMLEVIVAYNWSTQLHAFRHGHDVPQLQLEQQQVGSSETQSQEKKEDDRGTWMDKSYLEEAEKSTRNE